MRARKYRVASNDTVLSATRYGPYARLSRIISCRYTVVITDFSVSPYRMTRQELFTWIRQQYGTEPEYPWHDWNAVLRHNDNNKWYGVVLEVSADKLGLPEAGIIDVLNVKSDPLLIGSLRGQDGYFPAYHMNKEKWLSIQLGKPELDDAIKDLLSLSYELTAPKKRKPKSSAKNPGDFANGKEKETDEG